ncbi:hypothetical protein EYF80_068254 [Liparis tanakae]|uniref:Uncharacterized protein n=1 Tax=Liparis tanakae TaxID=230148 RepID=A0A4Z2DYL4_9TELE|nr:hypothetical protein EYF80_068254 [Liparis tanakae]
MAFSSRPRTNSHSTGSPPGRRGERRKRRRRRRGRKESRVKI